MSQVEAKNARKGNYIVVDGEPCIVRDNKKSKPGKHGSAKCKIKARGLFDEKDRVIVRPGDAMLDSPTIEKKAGQVVSKQGRAAQVMDLSTYETEEITLPEGANVEAGEEIKYWLVDGRVLLRED